MIFETFRQAIQNVWSNKLRTFLTMLGIIIGVMAVRWCMTATPTHRRPWCSPPCCPKRRKRRNRHDL